MARIFQKYKRGIAGAAQAGNLGAQLFGNLFMPGAMQGNVGDLGAPSVQPGGKSNLWGRINPTAAGARDMQPTVAGDPIGGGFTGTAPSLVAGTLSGPSDYAETGNLPKAEFSGDFPTSPAGLAAIAGNENLPQVTRDTASFMLEQGKKGVTPSGSLLGDEVPNPVWNDPNNPWRFQTPFENYTGPSSAIWEGLGSENDFGTPTYNPYTGGYTIMYVPGDPTRTRFVSQEDIPVQSAIWDPALSADIVGAIESGPNKIAGGKYRKEDVLGWARDPNNPMYTGEGMTGENWNTWQEIFGDNPDMWGRIQSEISKQVLAPETQVLSAGPQNPVWSQFDSAIQAMMGLEPGTSEAAVAPPEEGGDTGGLNPQDYEFLRGLFGSGAGLPTAYTSPSGFAGSGYWSSGGGMDPGLLAALGGGTLGGDDPEMQDLIQLLNKQPAFSSIPFTYG